MGKKMFAIAVLAASNTGQSIFDARDDLDNHVSFPP